MEKPQQKPFKIIAPTDFYFLLEKKNRNKRKEVIVCLLPTLFGLFCWETLT
jgi:hypothetical protein